MAKSSFTQRERDIWKEIYSSGRGPSSGRLRILVEEYASRGLVPVMMRHKDEFLPYDPVEFQRCIRLAFMEKSDNAVQVYYHPLDCERVLSMSATTWVRWGQVVIQCEAADHPDCDAEALAEENIPRLRLPDAAKEALASRGIAGTRTSSLLSARIVTFVIAAQYEAWYTIDHVRRVQPFKETVRKLGFPIREAVIRGEDLDFSSIGMTTPTPPIVETEPTVSELVAAIDGSDLEVEMLDLEMNALEEKMREMAAELALLRTKKEEERRRAEHTARLEFWRKAVVTNVRFDSLGAPLAITLQTPDGATSVARFEPTEPTDRVITVRNMLIPH